MRGLITQYLQAETNILKYYLKERFVMGKETEKTQGVKESQETQKPQKAKTNKVIVIILIIVIAILGIIIYMLLNPKKKNEDVVVTPKNVKEIQKALDDGPDPDAQYTVEMTNVWNVAGNTADNAYVKNAVQNHRTVFFDVTLEGEAEPLYKSDYLNVGDEVRGITLDKTLEPGAYKATLTYHLVDDNKEEITTTAVYITLNVS